MLIQPENSALDPTKHKRSPQKVHSDKLTPKQSEWAAIITEWEQSGLTQKEFCQKRNISKDLLIYYRSQIKKRRPLQKKLIPVSVIPEQVVKPTSDNYLLTLQSGAVLSIPCNSKADTLQPLLKILGVC